MAQPAFPEKPISRRRLWLMRLFVMIFVPGLLLGGLELGLRLGGFGYDTHFFRRIQIGGKDFYVPNEKFSDRFFPPALARTAQPIGFAADKGTNTCRIFLFGESAANGDPDPTFGVGRYLQVLLNERHPGTKFEVYSVALTAIDSSTILPIARECARHQGDLWVIYMGNNEMVGPFGAETSYGLRAPDWRLIRTLLAIKSTRIGQLLDSLVGRLRFHASTPKKWGGMEMFVKNRLGYDDPARLRAYANFQVNLEDILRAAHGAEVPVLLSTVAVNLKECAPFASMHGPGLDKNQEAEWNKLYQEGIDQEAAGSNQAALVFYQQAARIDPRYADLQFRMGTCDLALTNREQSLRDFELARDYDALDFRADTRINSAIKAAAARHAGQGVQLVDAAGDLAQKSADGIPGLELFYEHVHLNFAGNYLLARDFAGQIEKILPATISAHDRGSWASEKFCEARLAVTVWDRQRVWQPILTRVTAPPFTGQFNHEANLKVYEAKAREAAAALSTQTPEQAREIYRQALERAPDDYFLHGNYQRFLEAGGYLSEAIVEAKRCCELVPQLPGGFYYTATLLVREGKSAEAREYLAHALAIDGHYVEALDEMGEILANQQKTAEAMDWFHRAIRANPGHVNTYLDWGFFQQQQGQTAEAMANYQKAASRQPEGPADYFYRANVAASLFHWDEALACLQAVVKADPGFWQAHYQLGIQLAAKGEVRAAEAQFADTIRLRPDFIAAHLDLGTALWSLGKTNQALATYQGVLQLDPGNKKAEEEIGFIQQASTPAR